VISLRGYLLRRLGRGNEAADALLRSLELDPKSTSFIRETVDTLVPAGRCDEARTLINSGIEQHPSDDGIIIGDGYVALVCERNMEAVIQSSLNVEISTMPQIRRTTNALIHSRAFGEAVKLLTDARDSWVQRPTDFLTIDNHLTWLYRQTGQLEMADQTLRSGREHAAQISDRGVSTLTQLMKLAALEGDVEATRQFGEQTMAAMPRDAWRVTGYAYQVGRIYALAGLKDEAFSILENISYDHGYTYLSIMEIDPFLDNLRDDPRLQEIRANGMAQLEAARLAVP
jgi:tetratricopeptide (TPR) repeat protein